MSDRLPRVFSIAPSTPFLPQLVESWLAGDLGVGDPADPFERLSTTFYLPTRRAARTFADVLTQRLGGTALLPKIRTLADTDEQTDDAVDEMEDPDDRGTAGPIPKAIASTRRRIIFVKLLEKVRLTLSEMSDRQVGPALSSVAETVHLAKALEDLVDQAATEEIEWHQLRSVVPDDYAEYWQLSLELVSLITQTWPAILKEEGFVDPATRRRMILDRRADNVRTGATDGPIIVAGSTGSIPATARFMAEVAAYAEGAVILPGLDYVIPDRAFEALRNEDTSTASHPQYGLAQFLQAVGLHRADVGLLGAVQGPSHHTIRQEIISKAFLPADYTAGWRLRAQAGEAAEPPLGGVALLEAANETEESIAIAMAMKLSLLKGERVALVTPNKSLAKAVALQMERLDAPWDDSSGIPLSESVNARLLVSLANAHRTGFEPLATGALLKHPMLALLGGQAQTRKAVALVERIAYRGLAPRPGLSALKLRIDQVQMSDQDPMSRVPGIRKGLTSADFDTARTLVSRLQDAVAGLSALDPAALNFADYIEHLFAAAARLCEGADQELVLYEGSAGEALADLLSSVRVTSDIDLLLPVSQAIELFDAMLSERTLRSRGNFQGAANIWGPLEARLQPVDHVILGGLNEAKWPSLPRSNPLLSRGMMDGIGFSVPERRIGLSAHDVQQLLGTGKVTMTRSKKSDGSPTLPSRWVQRLLAVLPDDAQKRLRSDAERLLEAARSWSRPDAVTPIDRPKPTPGQPLLRLSITDVEKLIRDPYSVYAARILGLEAAPDFAHMPGAAERGMVFHDVVERVARRLDGLPSSDWHEAFDEEVEAVLDAWAEFPAIRAQWALKLKALAEPFLDKERAIEPARRLAEVAGQIELSVAGHSCRLSGRADRIDLMRDGSARVTDFKTGSVPSNKQVKAGLAPQLPLGAAIFERGGFSIDHAVGVSGYSYVRLGDPREPVKQTNFTREDASPDEALESLSKLWAAFLTGRPFEPLVRPQLTTYEGAYFHLSRAKEWRIADEDSGIL